MVFYYDFCEWDIYKDNSVVDLCCFLYLRIVELTSLQTGYKVLSRELVCEIKICFGKQPIPQYGLAWAVVTNISENTFFLLSFLFLIFANDY